MNAVSYRPDASQTAAIPAHAHEGGQSAFHPKADALPPAPCNAGFPCCPDRGPSAAAAPLFHTVDRPIAARDKMSHPRNGRVVVAQKVRSQTGESLHRLAQPILQRPGAGHFPSLALSAAASGLSGAAASSSSLSTPASRNTSAARGPRGKGSSASASVSAAASPRSSALPA